MLKRGKYGYVTNEQGVRFSRSEVARLNRAVEQANRILSLERSFKSIVTKNDSNFYNDRRANIDRFYTRQAFESYLKQTEQIAKGTYFRNVTIEYRKNYIKSLERNFGSDADQLVSKIKRMKLDDFRRLVDNDVIEDIGFFYYDSAFSGKDKIDTTNQAINEALGTYDQRGRPKGS